MMRPPSSVGKTAGSAAKLNTPATSSVSKSPVRSRSGSTGSITQSPQSARPRLVTPSTRTPSTVHGTPSTAHATPLTAHASASTHHTAAQGGTHSSLSGRPPAPVKSPTSSTAGSTSARSSGYGQSTSAPSTPGILRRTQSQSAPTSSPHGLVNSRTASSTSHATGTTCVQREPIFVAVRIRPPSTTASANSKAIASTAAAASTYTGIAGNLWPTAFTAAASLIGRGKSNKGDAEDDGKDADRFLCVKEGGLVVVEGPSHKAEKSFVFDYVADEHVTQGDVFQNVASHVISGCLDGYNGAILTYGPTQSGKSYTLFGSPEAEGIVPRAIDRIFEQIGMAQLSEDRSDLQVTCLLTMMEIYNECVYDLLGDANQKLGLLYGDGGCAVVDGLSEHDFVRAFDALELVRQGLSNRALAGRELKRKSYRSFVILNIAIHAKSQSAGSKRSLLTFADLGSDSPVSDGSHAVHSASSSLSGAATVDMPVTRRQSTASATVPKAAESGDFSLSTLRAVVQSLSSDAGTQLPPFGDSKLTLLLKDCFGGNTRTRIIATVDPAEGHRTASLATLNFATRCKLVRCFIRPNETARRGSITASLEDQVANLQMALARSKGRVRSMSLSSFPSMSDCAVQTDSVDSGLGGAAHFAGDMLGKMVTRFRTSVSAGSSTSTGPHPEGSQEALVETAELRVENAALKTELATAQRLLEEKTKQADSAMQSRNEMGLLTSAKETDFMTKISNMEAQREFDHQLIAELTGARNTARAKVESLEADVEQLRTHQGYNRESSIQLATVQTALERATSERDALATSMLSLEKKMKDSAAENAALRSSVVEKEEAMSSMRRQVEAQGVALLREAEELGRVVRDLRQELNARNTEVATLSAQLEGKDRHIRELVETTQSLDGAAVVAAERRAGETAEQLAIARRENETLTSRLMELSDALDSERHARLKHEQDARKPPFAATATMHAETHALPPGIPYDTDNKGHVSNQITDTPFDYDDDGTLSMTYSEGMWTREASREVFPPASVRGAVSVPAKVVFASPLPRTPSPTHSTSSTSRPSHPRMGGAASESDLYMSGKRLMEQLARASPSHAPAAHMAPASPRGAQSSAPVSRTNSGASLPPFVPSPTAATAAARSAQNDAHSMSVSSRKGIPPHSGHVISAVGPTSSSTHGRAPHRHGESLNHPNAVSTSPVPTASPAGRHQPSPQQSLTGRRSTESIASLHLGSMERIVEGAGVGQYVEVAPGFAVPVQRATKSPMSKAAPGGLSDSANLAALLSSADSSQLHLLGLSLGRSMSSRPRTTAGH